MNLVILAAGLGSRFGGLKQIEPMDDYGNFIIDYSIYDAIEAGFDNVCFIIKEEILEDFKNTIGKRIENKIHVEYAFQKNELPEGFVVPSDRVKPWGTGHAILSAGNVIDDSFVIINADDYYGKDAFKVAANYIRSLDKNAVGKYANVAFEAGKTITENGSVKRGVCFKDENGFLTNIIESSLVATDNNKIIATPLDETKKEFLIDADQLVSMNMFIFTKDIFKHLKEKFVTFLNEQEDMKSCEYLIPTVVADLIDEKQATVEVLSTTSTWYGVTYYQDKDSVYNALKKMTDEGKYKKGLWK